MDPKMGPKRPLPQANPETPRLLMKEYTLYQIRVPIYLFKIELLN